MADYKITNKLGLISGPLLFIIFQLIPTVFISEIADKVIAVAIWMIIWWLTEAVHISVTALVPLAIFPLLDVMDIKTVAANYSNPVVYLFFGGFVIALALEKVNLHKRIALNILKITGTNANGIILGFMLATALMSMWISNTASTVVMLPIASSVISLLFEKQKINTKGERNFALTIMLGIAFSANIGGIATLVGTPPNSVMLGILNNEFDTDIGFFQWMKIGVPLAIILLSICFFLITKIFYPNGLGKLKATETIIQGEINKLGKIKKNEKIVLSIFLLTAVSWILRSQINILFPKLSLTDTTISVLSALLMFVVPNNFRKGEFAIIWNDTSRLPWGILILFGGGLALAAGLSKAGIIDLIGNYVSTRNNWSIFIITISLIIIMVFMTELMSNVSLATVLIPVVGAVALGLHTDLLQMVIPVTLAASCAFMLPMATPPNAIVFASGHIKVHEMASIGIVLNIISVLLLSCLAYFLVPLIFT